ncbi:hypothetical protein ZWY2020_011044 [Hordeum vulgare]|nr:hypothetical protein ZWY2020_025252 [Hordeum vulgare]KAI5001085.1 hypothetical protein ZWY2020_011044 [Hordeum vulgare]
MPSTMNIAIFASYYSCFCAPNGQVQEKRTIMMDDVFIYDAHTFFPLLCVCVGRFDYMSVSTSRELMIRPLESEPCYSDAFLHCTCLRIGIVTNAQGHTLEVTSFLSMGIVAHPTCVACTMTYVGHLGPLTCTHVSDHAFPLECNIAIPHDIYTLCVASNMWINCSCHMLGCNNVHSSHLPCRIACYMLDLIASHMMTNCFFYCVECLTIFTTPCAHHAWFVLHFGLHNVFKQFISLGVVNDSYAYHRPFVECFVHACYVHEVYACYIATYICIPTPPLHTYFHDCIACAPFICLHDMPKSFVTPYDMHVDNTCSVIQHLNAWFCSNANHICFSKCLLYLLLS